MLVDLMRVPAAMAKQMLQKVFTNLCCHHQTRDTILKLLMRLLYLSMVDLDVSAPDGEPPSVLKQVLHRNFTNHSTFLTSRSAAPDFENPSQCYSKPTISGGDFNVNFC